MTKLEFGDLLDSGAITVTQRVQIYMDSFAREAVFDGKITDLPDGYRNFIVNGIMAEQDILKIRIKLF